MSLIYSALNKLEQGAPGAPEPAVVSTYPVATKRPGAPRWVYLVVAGCVVIVLGGWLSMNTLRAQFAATQVAAPAVAAAPVAVAAPAALAAPTPLPVMTPVMTPVQALPSPPELQAPTPAPQAPAPQAAPEPVKAAQIKRPARPRRAPVEMITEAAPPPVLDPQETARLTQAVKRAIQAGKSDEAQSLLKQLATRLPPESITLLRLNAWHSMQSGDPAQAMVLYRQITERIPADESAGINLALLHWKAGQQDEARRLIGALAERHPESETVQKYSRELGAPR